MKPMENSQIDASQDYNMKQKEAIQMKQEIKQLQHNNRQLMGEDLSALSLKDLHHLEQLMERSLDRVREKKEEILIDELEELNRKERCLYEENMKLRKMISMVESSSVAGTGQDFFLESMKCSEVQGETSEAAISVPNFSLQLNLSDSSESYHVTSKSRVASQLW
jgi:MADS-box transcription factor